MSGTIKSIPDRFTYIALSCNQGNVNLPLFPLKRLSSYKGLLGRKQRGKGRMPPDTENNNFSTKDSPESVREQ